MYKNLVSNYSQPLIIIFGIFYYLKNYQENCNLKKENNLIKKNNKLLNQKIDKIKTMQEKLNIQYLELQSLIQN